MLYINKLHVSTTKLKTPLLLFVKYHRSRASRPSQLFGSGTGLEIGSYKNVTKLCKFRPEENKVCLQHDNTC